jgi:hypothetical protein
MAGNEERVETMATTKKAPVTPETDAPRDPCACFCGNVPRGKRSRFIPGHDARVHSARKQMSALRDDLVLQATDEWHLPTDLPGLLLWLKRAGVTLEEFQTFPAWQNAPASVRVNEPPRPRRATRRAAGQDDTSRVDGSDA